jgi:hypothetical protein
MSLALDFLGSLAGAAFPPTLVLLALAACRRDGWRVGPGLRLALAAAGVILGLRILFAIGAIPVSGRYFQGLAGLSLVFAAMGVDGVADWLRRGLAAMRCPVPGPALARNLVMATVLAIFIGKALKPESDPKDWLHEIPHRIGEEAPGRTPLLVADVDDFRLGYRAGGRQIRVGRDGEVIRRQVPGEGWPKVRCRGGELAERGRGEQAGEWLELPGAQGWAHLAERLRGMGMPVFLVIRQDEVGFREEFSRRGLSFPFRKLAEYPGRKRKPPIILYALEDGDA